MSRDKVNKQPSSKKTGALPRSIGKIINKIKEEISPQGEQHFVREFRSSRNRTRSAVRFLILLIIVPVLIQFLSKTLIVSPIVERMRGENTSQVFLNNGMEDDALQELKLFEKRLKFQSFLYNTPSLSTEELEKQVKQKAISIAQEFREKSTDAISNVFADLISVGAFAILVATNRRQIATIKSFMDEIVYGLSDSAKAFFIIMFTDIFVGFHSPEGWEVILNGFAEHMGLPANRSVIFVFIATFPVILTSIFKYWIFNYLSRLSPSALATLKEMDE